MENNGMHDGKNDSPQLTSGPPPKKRGNRPGRKTKSQEEMEHRIEFTAHLVGQRLYKGDIKRVLKQRWGVSARMSEAYISRAKKLLAIRAGKPQEKHRMESYNFYTSIFNHPQATLRDKMWAQERIDSLFGLPVHTVRHQGDEERPIAHTVAVIDPVSLIERARQIAKEAEERRAHQHRTTIESDAQSVPIGCQPGVEATGGVTGDHREAEEEEATGT